MTVHIFLLGQSTETVWGLTPTQRLQRSLKQRTDVSLIEQPSAWPEQGDVLLLRTDYLYDARVLDGLIERQDALVLLDPRSDRVVAARASSARWQASVPAQHAFATLLEQALPADWPRLTPETVASGFQERLRKADRPWVVALTASNRQQVEHALFDGAYKGVTDFVTRFAWPHPARRVTGWCVRLGLQPNHVTAMSYLLTILATIGFWHGEYAWSLLAAWLMTFLDTVDGKLARVTLTATRFGNYFDHLLDLLHPPFWYLAWGVGLASWQFSVAVETVIIIIFAGYIVGRLCEGAFTWMTSFSMFVWRPLDSVNRLITARRNPNLLILTIAWLLGQGDIGLLLVAVWTVLSTLLLLLRLLLAIVVKQRVGELTPWLSQVDGSQGNPPLLVRMFSPGRSLADV